MADSKASRAATPASVSKSPACPRHQYQTRQDTGHGGYRQRRQFERRSCRAVRFATWVHPFIELVAVQQPPHVDLPHTCVRSGAGSCDDDHRGHCKRGGALLHLDVDTSTSRVATNSRIHEAPEALEPPSVGQQRAWVRCVRLQICWGGEGRQEFVIRVRLVPATRTDRINWEQLSIGTSPGRFAAAGCRFAHLQAAHSAC